MKRRRFVQGMLSASAMAALPAAKAAASSVVPAVAPAQQRPSCWLLDTAAFVDAESARDCARSLNDAHLLPTGEFLTPAMLAQFGGASFTAVLSAANAVLLHSLVRGQGLMEAIADRKLARDIHLNPHASLLSVRVHA